MEPVNTKSLLVFVFHQMERLNSGEIDANTACAQAKLASQACNLLNYELKAHHRANEAPRIRKWSRKNRTKAERNRE